MAELVSRNLDNRAIFPRGEQAKFLNRARESFGVSWPRFAQKFSVHRRTMSDWKREKYSMSFKAVERISREANVTVPSKIELRDRYWYITIGAVAGAAATLKKYGRVGGDPEYRKKKWYEWWEREGRYKSTVASVKPIVKPRRSKELAEFVGIAMGDGGITKRQVTITLNKYDDKLYALFVAELMENLFGVKPSVYDRESVTSIVVSRVQLVDFCESIGLKIGNKVKQNFDIPEWIKTNKSFQIACMRGLMDTDGCIFQEVHKINGKNYCYARLAFTSYSDALRSSVVKTFEQFGFSPKLRSKRNVQLEKNKDIEQYFELIGTNNPKHRQRFTKFTGGVR